MPFAIRERHVLITVRCANGRIGEISEKTPKRLLFCSYIFGIKAPLYIKKKNRVLKALLIEKTPDAGPDVQGPFPNQDKIVTKNYHTVAMARRAHRPALLRIRKGLCGRESES